MIAFFDIDKTLIRVNSANLWIRHELRQGTLSKRQAARGAFWASLYGLGLADVERVLREAVAQLAGRREDEIVTQTERFFDTQIRDTIRPGAREAVARHRDRGDHLVLLTSSSNYMARLIAAELDCDDWLSNRFEVDDQGVFTGLPHEPLCYGAGKATHAERWARGRDIDLADCAFYTDSHTDLPALEAVGRPFAVHPDPRLARVARRRGWEILDWER